MAAKKGEDSKQGLIIALVFFVLLSIGLGVATYYGFAEQDRLTKAAKEEKTKAEANKNSRDWEQFQNLLLKSYIGHPLAKEDQEAFTSLLPKYESGALAKGENEKSKADFDGLVKKLADEKTVLGWDDAKKQPKNNFLAELDRLNTQFKQKDKELVAAQTKFKRDLDELSTNLKTAQGELEKTRVNLAQSNKEKADLLAAKSAEYTKALESIEKLQNEVDDIKKKMDLAKDSYDKGAVKDKKVIEDYKNQVGRLNDQIKPVNLENYDQPKGKIVNIERTGAVAYINLGSADNVKPQLTFSIFAPGANGTANRNRKGALEVTNILGPHLSRAHFTELADGNRDPAVTGDLLFNPIWSSSLKQHVAIAGLIDLTGEGRDNTQEFIHGLERQNIVVDAYIDLKNLAVKGPGLSLKTNYLVRGDNPEFDATSLQPGDKRTQNKQDLIKAMGQMQEEAQKLGITIIPYRRFLALIGYPLPRALTNRSGSSNYLDSPLLGSKVERKEAEKDKDKEKEDKPKDGGKEKDEKGAGKEKEK